MNEYIVYVDIYGVRGSHGIYGYHFAPASASLNSLGLQAEVVNPSFFALSTNFQFLYAVSETSDFGGEQSGSVCAYRVNAATGDLTFLNEVASLGAGPCHLCLDKTSKFVLVPNFHGGSMSVFPVLPDGRLSSASGFVQHYGSTADPDRQEISHAHAVVISPDNLLRSRCGPRARQSIYLSF